MSLKEHFKTIYPPAHRWVVSYEFYRDLIGGGFGWYPHREFFLCKDKEEAEKALEL